MPEDLKIKDIKTVSDFKGTGKQTVYYFSDGAAYRAPVSTGAKRRIIQRGEPTPGSQYARLIAEKIGSGKRARKFAPAEAAAE